MSFLDTVRQAKSYLEEQGRVSLSALKLEFDLDDARLQSLIEELVDVQQVAAREGKVLVWVGPARSERAIAELSSIAYLAVAGSRRARHFSRGNRALRPGSPQPDGNGSCTG